MTAPDPNCNRLVADIGGTTTRLALFDPVANEFRALCTFVNREHAQFEGIIAIWLHSLGEPAASTQFAPYLACTVENERIIPKIVGDRSVNN